MTDAIRRSYLFVPATRTDRIAKAHAAGPDAVILDLEDAVAPTEKDTARAAAARDVPAAGPVLVRINGPETDWFEDDLRLCAQLRVEGVLVPKAEDAADIARAAERLGTGIPVLPLIETARGYANLSALCAAPQVQRLAFGSIDFQLDLGIDGEGEELLAFRSGLVLASRLAGLQPPIDGVTVEIQDPEAVRRDVARARRLGFGGKLCIHPKQVEAVNACWQPGADEIAWARRVVEAATAAKGGAVAVDGKMVDKPVILRAEDILREAARRETR